MAAVLFSEILETEKFLPKSITDEDFDEVDKMDFEGNIYVVFIKNSPKLVMPIIPARAIVKIVDILKLQPKQRALLFDSLPKIPRGIRISALRLNQILSKPMKLKKESWVSILLLKERGIDLQPSEIPSESES